MSIIVTDSGFAPEDFGEAIVPLADLTQDAGAPLAEGQSQKSLIEGQGQKSLSESQKSLSEGPSQKPLVGSAAAPGGAGAVSGAKLALELGPADDPGLLSNRLSEIAFIRVRFPSFADGRGFTIAARLRRMGFRGRLRAAGHVIADQYAMARRSGFDEVEIDAELAARQPEDQWLRRADWRAHDYRARLRG